MVEYPFAVMFNDKNNTAIHIDIEIAFNKILIIITLYIELVVFNNSFCIYFSFILLFFTIKIRSLEKIKNFSKNMKKSVDKWEVLW